MGVGIEVLPCIPPTSDILAISEATSVSRRDVNSGAPGEVNRRRILGIPGVWPSTTCMPTNIPSNIDGILPMLCLGHEKTEPHDER